MSKRPPPPGPVRLTSADVAGHASAAAAKQAGRDGARRRGPLATAALLLLLSLLGGGIYYAAVVLRVPNADQRLAKSDAKRQAAGDDRETAERTAAAAIRNRKSGEGKKAATETAAAIPPAEPLGLYSERTRPDREKWIGGVGGTPESELGVAAGVDWLARHQAEDGHWGPDCLGPGGSRCEKEHPCDGPGGNYEAALTGLALLAFQAGGNYDFNDRPRSDNVRRGLDWLVERQGPNGELAGSRSRLGKAPGDAAHYDQRYMYEHALGAFALAEACALARAARHRPDKKYQAAAVKAVQFIESQQHDDGGWRYRPNKSDPSDCSVSGWSMLALKTAKEAELSVDPETIRRMTAFFENQADHLTGRTHYQGQTFVTDATTGVGMMVDEFVKRQPDSDLVQHAALYLADQAEAEWAPGRETASDFYLWYNCTLAMFMADGEPWKRWNGVVRDHLLHLQIHGSDCTRGSWEPNDRWGREGGRVYSTALAVLSLEVYYRFARERADQSSGDATKQARGQ